MLGRWQSGRKIDIAKKLLSNMVDSLQDIENLEIGLRVYGHKSGYPPQDCDDTHLEVNFLKAEFAVDLIKKKLKARKLILRFAKFFLSKNNYNLCFLLDNVVCYCITKIVYYFY